MTRYRVLAAAVGTTLLVACSGDGSTVASMPRKPSTLNWTVCSEKALAAAGLECATLTVPKDYSDVTRGHFTLAVVRAPATGPDSERIGSLFFNPGGPGSSGVDVVAALAPELPAELRARFDLVSWDPRGVGRSSGLGDCANGAYVLPATGDVDWTAVLDQARASEKSANEDCARRHPDVVPYIGTNDTVRDLDALREAAGDEKLTYWGTSYGTRIGYGYGYRYPDRVRAMLLTSPVDPNATLQSFVLGSGTAQDGAIGFFFEAYPTAARQFNAALAALSASPLVLPSGARITQWELKGGIVGEEPKSEGNYPGIVADLADLDTALNGSGGARQAALAALDRKAWPDQYPVNGGATAFIDCLDFPQRLTASEQYQIAATVRAQAPIFGWAQSVAALFCEGIDVKPNPVPVNFVNTRTPVLVIGSTRDALTQYGWVNEVTRSFLDSRVVSYVGTVHTPYMAKSACVDAYGTDYLLTLRRPAVDAICPNAVVGH